MPILVPTTGTVIASTWGKSVADALNSLTTLSATPPASPVDGQYWAMSPAAGILWLFRYNATGGTHKWEFAGGSPLIGFDATSGSPASGSWALGSPSLVVARAGIYTGSCVCEASAPSAMRIWMGITSGAAASPFTSQGPTVAASSFVSLVAPERETTVTAGATISATYTASAPGGSVAGRQIRVVPRAVS